MKNFLKRLVVILPMLVGHCLMMVLMFIALFEWLVTGGTVVMSAADEKLSDWWLEPLHNWATQW